MARTKQQNELIVLGVLLVVAAAVWYSYFGRAAKPNSGLTASGGYTQINAQDYVVLLKGLEKAQNTEYKSSGRNIFVIGPMPVEVAKQQGPVTAPFRNVGPTLPPPPPAPVLPFVFFGYGMVPSGGPREAFLKEENGDDVFIVGEGDVMLNHFRILHIGNERLEFEDTTTGMKGSKNLEGPPAA
jgi:hypothetical protein